MHTVHGQEVNGVLYVRGKWALPNPSRSCTCSVFFPSLPSKCYELLSSFSSWPSPMDAPSYLFYLQPHVLASQHIVDSFPLQFTRSLIAVPFNTQTSHPEAQYGFLERKEETTGFLLLLLLPRFNITKFLQKHKTAEKEDIVRTN